MKKVKIKLISKNAVCSQIVTGFKMLEEQKKIKLEIVDNINDNNYKYHVPVVIVEYENNVIVYDMMDGYQNIDAMKYYLNVCDYYFKRSYCSEKTEQFGNLKNKMYPLGFNYHVTYRGNPLNESKFKSFAKILLLKKPQYYYTYKTYENKIVKNKVIKIAYWARLWDEQEHLTPELTQERDEINNMRFKIVELLTKEFGENFIGGLADSPLARKLGPQYIINKKYENKWFYLKMLKKCDVGVATKGLHESVGWKFGEYLASSLAIVTESFDIEIPGQFKENINYLTFKTPNECVEKIKQLVTNEEKLINMKKNNNIYYNNYLKPDKLIEKTLENIKIKE